MANVLVEKQSLIDTADAIRAKLGTQALIAPEDFDDRISEISGGKDYCTLTIASYTTTGAVDSVSQCTASFTDDDAFLEFAKSENMLSGGYDSTEGETLYEIYLSYNSYEGWYNNMGSNGTYYTTEMLANAGLSITLNQGATYGSVRITYNVTVDTSNTTQVSVTDSMEYASLGYLSTEYSHYGGGRYGYPVIFILNGGIELRSCIIGYEAGADVTEVPDCFLANCDNLASVDFTGVTKIGSYCMASCGNFNVPITFPSSVATVGGYFMYECSSFNQPITLPATITSLGTGFLGNCDSFNSSVTLLTTSPQLRYFLGSCSSFNQSITIPPTAVDVYEFLGQCSAFNQPITIPNGVKNVNSFLQGCSSFNQPITIPASVTLSNAFLTDCAAFNSTITISGGVTKIGNYFLQRCYAFNKSITIPNTVTTIDSYFLFSCTAFNSTISLPSSLTTIGTNFLQNVPAYNKDLTLPASITSIGAPMMYNCKAMVSTVYANCSADAISANTSSLATNDNTAACYTTGIKVGGTYGYAWRSKHANRTSSPYRKLIAA